MTREDTRAQAHDQSPHVTGQGEVQPTDSTGQIDQLESGGEIHHLTKRTGMNGHAVEPITSDGMAPGHHPDPAFQAMLRRLLALKTQPGEWPEFEPYWDMRPKPVDRPRRRANGHDTSQMPPEVESTRQEAAGPVASVTIQVFTRAAGKPMTKTIGLVNGKAEVIGTDTAMARGTSESITTAWPHGVAKAIGALTSSQALAPCNADLGTRTVVAKDLLPLHDTAFARTKEAYPYTTAPALMLFDFDDTTPDDNPSTRWATLTALCPALNTAGRVVTASVSSYIEQDGVMVRPAGNEHRYVCALDGTDIARATEALFVRAWLTGHGRIKIGNAGQMLLRGPFDAAVFGSNHLCFEGPPILADASLVSRRPAPQAFDGPMLDTRACIPDLTSDERGRYESLVAIERAKHRPTAEKTKRQHDAVQVEMLIERGVPEKQARATVESRTVGGTLAREDVLYTRKGTVSVADVLADLEGFDCVACADPAEPAYPAASGAPTVGKAIIFANLPDGIPLVYSHAHGGQKFYLRPKRGSDEAERETLDSLRAMDDKAFNEAWPGALAALAVDQRGAAITLVQERTGKDRAPIKERIKQELAKARASAEKAKLDKYLAGRKMIGYTPDNTDAQALVIERLAMDKAEDGEWLQFGGALAYTATQVIPGSHRIDDDTAEPPAVPVLVVHDPASVIRMFERVACLVEKTAQGLSKPIEVPPAIVRQTLKRKKLIAPVVNGIVTHPIVRFDGEIVTKCGLDPSTGLYVAHNLGDIKVARLSEKQAQAALQRLRKTFLAGFEFESNLDRDAALYLLMTGLMRKLLDEAPMGSIEASVQQSGKTTLARKINITMTGHDLPTFAFPDNEEEMRKLLTTALMHSPAVLCFDNVRDGATVSSPALSKVLTGAAHEDRLLGVNREVLVPTNTLILLTGNNLSRGADEATRVIQSRLTSSKVNPADRTYPDRDVMAATLRDRIEVLQDALGILSGYLANHGTKDAPSGMRAFRWSASVFGALLWAGAENVSERTTALMATAKVASGVTDLVASIFAVFSDKLFTITDLIDGQEAGVTFGADRHARNTLHECLGMLTRSRNGTLSKQAVTALVTKYTGVPVALESGTWAIELAMATDAGKRHGSLYKLRRLA